VLNAANEVAVQAFLAKRIGFLAIAALVEATLEAAAGLTAAAPKNPILVILLLLIPTHHMGRRRAGLALQQQHSRHATERRSRFGDPYGHEHTGA
jgi:hypothetical protein